MTTRRRNPCAQRGNALLSVAIGLVLVSIILAGVIMWFASTQRQAAIANLGSTVMQLQTNVENGFMNRATYEGLDSRWALDAEVLPSGLKASHGANIRHGLSGRLSLSTHTTIDSEFSNNAMAISLTGLDADACVKLIQQVLPQHSDQLFAFRIADHDAGTGTSYYNRYGYPDVNQILEDCEGAADGAPSLIFYYKK